MKYLRYLWYPIVLVSGIVGYFLINWDRIPAQIPRQYGFNGVVGAWWPRGMGFAAAATSVLFMIVVLYLVLRQLEADRKLGIGSRFKKSALVLIMYGVSGLLTILNTGMVFRLVQGMKPVAPTTFMVVGTILLSLAIGCLMLYMDKTPDNGNPLRENSGCWKGYFFYYDPQDARVWVEKRTGLGWTLNFARPVSWVISAGIAGLIFMIIINTV